MIEKLKPCPLCVDSAPSLRQPPHQNFIECLECGASGPNCSTEAGAVSAWNRRPTEDKLVEALERIASYKGQCLLGPESTTDCEESYRAGSNAAFEQLAEQARAALKEVEGEG